MADGFGGIPASCEAIAGLKRQNHGDNDDHAVSGQTKRRRRGTGDDYESKTNEEAAAVVAAAAAACAICLDDFEDGDGLAVMPCTHWFHEGCLTEWLALSCLCPCCRHALPSEGEGKAPAPCAATTTMSVADGDGARLLTRPGGYRGFQGSVVGEERRRLMEAAATYVEEGRRRAATLRRAMEAATTRRAAVEAAMVGEVATTRRSRRARQANVRLFGPEWDAETSNDGLS